VTSVKNLLLEYRFPVAFAGVGDAQREPSQHDTPAALALALRSKLPALRARVQVCQLLGVGLFCVLLGELVWQPSASWLSGAGVSVFGALTLLWHQARWASATELLIEIAASGDRRTLNLLVDKLLVLMGATPPLDKSEGVPAAE
jgi:hypothetical protein